MLACLPEGVFPALKRFQHFPAIFHPPYHADSSCADSIERTDPFHKLDIILFSDGYQRRFQGDSSKSGGNLRRYLQFGPIISKKILTNINLNIVIFV